jgi:prohibitin 1
MANPPPPLSQVKIIRLAIAVPLVFILIISSTVNIRSGHAGLLFRTFNGGVSSTAEPLGAGFHFKAPWNKIFEYEIRQKERMERLEVLSANLLKMEFDMSVLFQPAYEELGNLERERGPFYESKVVVPTMRSVAREVIAKYLPEEFNTTRREDIQHEIETEMRAKLAENFIQLNDVLIRNIKVPKKLEEAIERKLQQEQESLEYEFRLEKETKEAERKRIEAKGIRDFQEIVSSGISEELLRWKGIEATSDLANSPNTKVVIVGSGKDGLPLILGGNN